MTTLKIELNSAGISVGMFRVSSQQAQTQINFNNYPNHVLVTGLDDWALWREEFLAILNDDQKQKINFIEI